LKGINITAKRGCFLLFLVSQLSQLQQLQQVMENLIFVNKALKNIK